MRRKYENRKVSDWIHVSFALENFRTVFYLISSLSNTWLNFVSTVVFLFYVFFNKFSIVFKISFHVELYGYNVFVVSILKPDNSQVTRLLEITLSLSISSNLRRALKHSKFAIYWIKCQNWSLFSFNFRLAWNSSLDRIMCSFIYELYRTLVRHCRFWMDIEAFASMLLLCDHHKIST